MNDYAESVMRSMLTADIKSLCRTLTPELPDKVKARTCFDRLEVVHTVMHTMMQKVPNQSRQKSFTSFGLGNRSEVLL